MARFKVDENLPEDVVQILTQAGHDASSVIKQNLQGCADDTISNVCRDEDRALITLDLDFADIRRYPPEEFPGIIVIRASQQDRPSLINILRRMLPVFDGEKLASNLWIVDETGVRVRGE